MTHPGTTRQASRIESVIRTLFFSLLLIVSHLLGRLSADFEVIEIEMLCWFLFTDQQSNLLWIRRTDLFADKDVGKRLVIVKQTTIGID